MLTTALKEILQSTKNKVYTYNKGNSFVILNYKDALQKIEEFGESVESNSDPTSSLTKII